MYQLTSNHIVSHLQKKQLLLFPDNRNAFQLNSLNNFKYSFSYMLEFRLKIKFQLIKNSPKKIKCLNVKNDALAGTHQMKRP